MNPRFASVQILCLGTTPLKETFTGVIRQQDVRATEVDKVRFVCVCVCLDCGNPRQVEIYKCFRPGDIVLAEVVSFAHMNIFDECLVRFDVSGYL